MDRRPSDQERKGKASRGFLGALLLAAILAGGCAEAQEVRSFTGSVEGQDPAARLLRHLVTALSPERLELVLEAAPDESGAVRRLYFEATGSRRGGVRLDRLRLEAVFVKLRLPREAAAGAGLDRNSVEAVQGYFEGRVTEKDLNDFLLGATLSSGGAQWRDLKLDLKPQGFSASARFAAGAVSALVEVHSALKIQDRDRLRMTDYRVVVNNAQTDMAEVMGAIEKAQPLLDFRDFPFPVQLRQLDLDEDALVLGTRTRPQRFEGLTLIYQAR